MKIVADKNIPFLKGIAEQYGEVTYLAGNEFTRETVKDADTLIVRTVTYLGRELLEGSNVKLICSATIGYDHIDTGYCEQHGIVWRNAPGCNSGSVMQYVISSIIDIAKKKNLIFNETTVGIIGVGNVGGKVATACQILGMKVLLNDPPRQEAENPDEFVDIETIKRESDIITFHTPLTQKGKYKTLHMADAYFFNSLDKCPVIINTARGAIIDTDAIKEALSAQKISGTIIDCWENEPEIDKEYMNGVDIATPHIAGYSADGKANATRMSLISLARFWNLPEEPVLQIKVPEIAEPYIDIQQYNNIYEAILHTYNPLDDHKRLIANPSDFSKLRSNYPLRREYGGYTVMNVNETDENILRALGFNIRS